MYGTLKGKKSQRLQPEPLRRIARGVALAIGISLFATPANAPALNLSSKQFAYTLLKENKTQYRCLAQLWGKESAWDAHAYNPSGAYGIPQLKNKKIYNKDQYTQVIWGLRYIKHRYHTPCRAWAYWKRHNNY